MADFIFTIGIFASKVFIILFLLGGMLTVIALTLSEHKKEKHKKTLEIKDIGQSLKDYGLKIQSTIYCEKQFKKLLKTNKKDDKKNKKNLEDPSLVYVLKFKGDIQATRVAFLKEEISILLQIANPKKDEVVLKLNNNGGAVNSHGLAASQLQRLRDAGFNLTICVDEMAASGGYLMACVAHKILAAPFAIIGSIGVLAQMPNFHRLLQKQNIDFEEHHAGKHKRTLTLFGETTDEKRQKLQSQLEEIHTHFKSYITKYRPTLNMDKIATGEYWLGTEAKKLGLIDNIITSDAYILSLLKDNKKVYEVNLKEEKQNNLKRFFAKTMAQISAWI